MHSIKNNLFVEYFIWCLLKNHKKDGKISSSALKNIISSSVLKYHLKNNLFFNYHDGFIFLKSLKLLGVSIGRKNFFIEEDDIQKLKHTPCRLWTKTDIKYLFVVITACKYSNAKPYGIRLISSDLEVSESTVYRALRCPYIKRKYEKQVHDSPRSHPTSTSGYVNYTANFYSLLLGKLTYNKAG